MPALRTFILIQSEGHNGAQALAAFRSNVYSQEDKRAKAARAALRFCRATEAAAMAGWRERAAHRAALRRTAQKALASMQNRVTAAALRSWRDTAADLAERRQQVNHSGPQHFRGGIIGKCAAHGGIAARPAPCVAVKVGQAERAF